jgi:predicted nucleic acid-binding protein
VGRELILDTGPLVALLDQSEESHEDCVRVLREHVGPILSTEPVLTEAQHLLAFDRRARNACLEFFLRGAFTLVPTDLESLRRVSRLMGKYADVPMDFADATMVVLAEDLGHGRVFTLDRRGFEVYRWRGRRAFEIVP